MIISRDKQQFSGQGDVTDYVSQPDTRTISDGYKPTTEDTIDEGVNAPIFTKGSTVSIGGAKINTGLLIALVLIGVALLGYGVWLSKKK